MGMSTYVNGIVPGDDKFRLMKRIYDDCITANIAIPDEVWKLFNYEPPNENGVILDLPTDSQKEYQNDSCAGIEVYLDKIPAHIKIIRFINSY